MKIVFVSLLISNDVTPVQYAPGNTGIDYKGEVSYPVNAVLAKTLQKGEHVKVILLATRDIADKYEYYIAEYKKELDAINKGIEANLSYETILMTFEPTKRVFEETLLAMIDALEENAEIIADITHSSKPTPLIIFSALNFAEKFYNAKIQHIVYGKIDFVKADRSSDAKAKPENGVLFDMSPMYYLNSLTNVMECSSSEQAVEMLKKFFAM